MDAGATIRRPTLIAQPAVPECPCVGRTGGPTARVRSTHPAPKNVDHVAVISGHEVRITRRQYEHLVANKDDLLQDFTLIVDRVAGDVFLRTSGTWTRLDFRIRDTSTGIRSGPFSLLSIYARYPGRRFTNGELRAMISQDLTDRLTVNVGDFISQLRRRRPRIPVEQDDNTSFLPDSLRVCLLDQRQ